MTRRRSLRSDDICRMRWLSAVACRPAGDVACLIETSLDAALGTSVSRLVVVDLSSGDLRTAPVSYVAPFRPAWDPTGRYLAFVAGREGDRRLFHWDVLNSDGALRSIGGSDELQVGGAPSWSPGGDRIVYPVEVLTPRSPWRRPTDQPIRLVQTDVFKRDGQPVGAPQPQRWLRVSSLAGDEYADITPRDANATTCVWSPDGAHIAFLSDKHRDVGSGLPAALWLVTPDGDELRRLTAGDGLVAAPTWAPDGSALAYIANADAADRAQNQVLRVIDLVSGTDRLLTGDLDVSVGTCVQSDDIRGYGDSRLCWPAGDRGILCSFPRGGSVALTWIDPARPDATAGDSLTSVGAGARVALSFDTSADGATVAFVSSDVMNPGELYVARGDGAGERPLTARNAEWAQEIDLAQVRQVTAVASDGIRVEAWLYLPAETEEPLSPRPLILAIHGGPHWPCGWRFSFEYQRLAGLGYAVAVANPRGSQGYGEAFAKATQQDWGNLDVVDELAVLDTVRREPEVDPRRAVATGVSYGGYLTCLLLATTDQFSAAVAENGVSDLTSYFGTTADGGRFVTAELGTPWQGSDLFRERSPLTHVASVRDPLLLVHGELDQDCPLGQSEQMYTALRRLQQTVELAVVPGEGHLMVINGTLAHRLQRWAVIDDFLGRHVPVSDRGDADAMASARVVAG